MTTEHDLDARLLATRGVRDADLPALPEAFLDYLHNSDFLDYLRAPDTERPAADARPVRALLPVPAEPPASVLAAQQLVDDAHQRRSAAERSRRRPGRKTVVRLSAAVLAVAAAWTTAVVVTASSGSEGPPAGTASPSGSVAPPTGGVGGHGITLVAAEAVTFPLSLDPAPAGLTPYFSRWGGITRYGNDPLVFTADYRSADGNGFTLTVFPKDPRGAPDLEAYGGWPQDGADIGTVTIDGTAAQVAHGGTFADLLWERRDGQWVRILGDDAYGDPAALVAVAESLVDRPQPVGLQFGLAPAGWSVSGYEESRSLDLTSDADPQQMMRLSLHGQGAPESALDDVLAGMTVLSSTEPVTLDGRPAALALVESSPGWTFWYVVGQLPNGPLFLLLAPDTLTREQVLQIASQVTYTP